MKHPTRRELAGLLLGATAVAACEDEEAPPEKGPWMLPPPTARVQTTACAYCIVGCGYKVYSWPVEDPTGRPAAADNALETAFPVQPFGPWVSPQMHNVVAIDGVQSHIVVLPDPDATVVNLRGDHTLGGSLARKLYNPGSPTKDRLQHPQIRIGDTLEPISWDEAFQLMARYSRFVLDTYGELAWGMKTYSYQFYENTFAITRLAFEAINTPCWAPHDKTAEGSDTPGISDAGINVFSASYQDWHDADVIFCSGVSLYDAHGVLFSQWVERGGAKLVVVNPRRDPTADYAIETGGLFLQIRPGTDTALHRALARIMVEQDWVDHAFLEGWVAKPEDLLAIDIGKWRQTLFATTFHDFVDDLLNDPDARAEDAAEICGIDADLIWQAAEMLARPSAAGHMPKTSFMLEKGNYWSHNYQNTASFVNVALLCGAGNRPGRMISRAGGHQRGMIKAASYPEHKSPHTFNDHAIGLDLDRWTREGELAFCWVIGCTWAGGGSAASDVLYESIRQQTRNTGEALSPEVLGGGSLDVDAVVANWKARAQAGGMVLVQSDLYAQALTELVDLVLPAAGWGEGTFTRMNGERRMRLYPRLCDPPGEALPDWQIVAGFAQEMGFEGFDWKGSYELFEECAAHSDGPHAFHAVVQYAVDNGLNARDVLRETGTTGLQCPVSYEDGALHQTVRYHDAAAGRGFSTPTGKANFVTSRWSLVEDRQAELEPQGEELWIINRRTSMNWSAMVEDNRIPFRVDQLPVCPLELHPDDAQARGIEDGQPVVVQTDGTSTVIEPFSLGTSGRFEAVAVVTDRVRKGVACAYFNYGGEPATAANNAVSNSTEAITNKQSFKLGRGRVLPA